MRCGGPGLPPTLVRATHCQRTTILPRQAQIRQRRPSRSRTQRHVAPDAPKRELPRRTDVFQDPARCGQRGRRGRGHRTRVHPDTLIAPVAWTPVAWTPDVRPTSGRTSAWRTADADRATSGVSGVRTAPTATATATAGWLAQIPLGLPHLWRSATPDSSAVTTPASTPLTTAATEQLRSTARHEAAPRRTAVVCWIWMVRGEGNGTTES
jgi:hypothetical protein